MQVFEVKRVPCLVSGVVKPARVKEHVAELRSLTRAEVSTEICTGTTCDMSVVLD